MWSGKGVAVPVISDKEGAAAQGCPVPEWYPHGMLPPPRHGMARRRIGRDRQDKHDGWTDPGAHYVFLSILLKRGRSQLTEEGI